MTTNDRVTLRWGVKEWLALATFALGIIGAAAQMRDDVLTKFNELRGELIGISTKLEAFMTQQRITEGRQDAQLDRFGDKQANVRERLQSLEDEHKRSLESAR